MSAAGSTTIVVLSVDEGALLEHSLPAAVAQPDAEVVVVDNACTDSTAHVVAAQGARRLELEHRVSYTAHGTYVSASATLAPGTYSGDQR